MGLTHIISVSSTADRIGSSAHGSARCWTVTFSCRSGCIVDVRFAIVSFTYDPKWVIEHLQYGREYLILCQKATLGICNATAATCRENSIPTNRTGNLGCGGRGYGSSRCQSLCQMGIDRCTSLNFVGRFIGIVNLIGTVSVGRGDHVQSQ